ncbi:MULTISPECIES: hypothetical protein [Sphingobacterium]|uniref:hypothetical protein n=1 Tax=Sphingobacterium TaxID=28453 RepID=UPI000389DA4F|nr:hypothetical protein [Sphingobacterium sp. IITKGP-BTPF85]KKX47068.1 hypothetical protein L950_0228470 [Sphingobacterium sp. IITKGP-BTPF85]
MRTFKTVVAALAMVVAIGSAIAAGQTTKAPTVFIDNGTPNPIPVDLALKDAPAGTPGAWTCSETELTACYFHDRGLTDASPERGEYQPL